MWASREGVFNLPSGLSPPSIPREVSMRETWLPASRQYLCLSLGFTLKGSVSSSIQRPFAVMKCYCCILTNKSQQPFIAAWCEIRPPNQLDATACCRNGDDCQCSWLNSIRDIFFFFSLVKGIVKMNALQTSEICTCIKELLEWSNSSMIFELSRHSTIIDVAALSHLIKIGVTDLLLKI